MEKESGFFKNQLFAGQAAVFMCAVLWSSSGLFIKLVDWHPALITGSRSVLSVFTLLFLRRFIEPVRKPGNTLALLASGFWYGITMILFVFANKLTTSANVILLQYTSPIWAALLGWFMLKEKPHWEHYAALLFIGPGMFLILSGGLASGGMKGDIIAIISGLTFGINSVVLRKHKDTNSLDIMIGSHLVCVLFSIPFFFLYPPQLSVGSILSIVYMGIFQLGLACGLFVYGLKRITAVQSMLIVAIEPVLNPLWVLLILGERPTNLAIAGGCFILAAVICSSLITNKRAAKLAASCQQ